MTRIVQRQSMNSQEQQTVIASLPHLLNLLQVCDSVFAFDNAFSDDAIKISLGRIYRQWKDTSKGLNPDFDPKKHRLEHQYEL